MNDWIESKVDEAKEYLRNAINVPSAEDFLKVSKYGQLAKTEKDSIVIRLREVCCILSLCLILTFRFATCTNWSLKTPLISTCLRTILLSFS